VSCPGGVYKATTNVDACQALHDTTSKPTTQDHALLMRHQH
jgi:hypothetical protein